MRLPAVSVVVALAALGAQSASAGDFALSELRAGVMAHSADPFTAENLSRIQDVNFEALFTAPYLDSFTFLNGQLRPRIGATVNFGGLESMVNLGLSWHVPIGDTGVWVEGTLGGAIHNGSLTGPVTYPARPLGCTALFYEAASVGVDLSDSVTAMVTLEHASNANLCVEGNRGLTNLGFRLGVKF